MVFHKMVAICPGFKCLGFLISDPIPNSDHLQPNLFLTIQNPDYSRFQIPTVVKVSKMIFLQLPEPSKWEKSSGTEEDTIEEDLRQILKAKSSLMVSKPTKSAPKPESRKPEPEPKPESRQPEPKIESRKLESRPESQKLDSNPESRKPETKSEPRKPEHRHQDSHREKDVEEPELEEGEDDEEEEFLATIDVDKVNKLI